MEVKEKTPKLAERLNTFVIAYEGLYNEKNEVFKAETIELFDTLSGLIGDCFSCLYPDLSPPPEMLNHRNSAQKTLLTEWEKCLK